jgi:hypothetical protein
MSVTLQILGAVAVIVLFATILIRPAGIFLAILAVGLVIAGIVVSWRDVEQYRAQKAAGQQPQQTTAAVPAPLPEYPRSGS